MGKPQSPYANRGPIEYTSIASAVPFAPPIVWIQVVSAGSGGLVVKAEDGTARTYTGLVAGDVLSGPFSEITSMTCSKIRVGDGPVPAPNAALTVGQISTTLTTSQGLIELRPSDFYLATGAPLAVFANGASAVPGMEFTGSKGMAIRWNNHAAPNAVLGSFRMPPDADTTANMIMHVRAAKTGATLADATTFLVAAYNQVDGALYDADSDFGGTSGAMTGDATAKTIQNVTLTLALANLANPTTAPASVTVTLKPTDGTLGTDDVCVFGVDVYYTKKLLAS